LRKYLIDFSKSRTEMLAARVNIPIGKRKASSM